MYENITPELRSLLEPRLDLLYFAKKNFCFKSLTFKEIDNLNFENIYNQITIFFLLDENFEDLKNTDNLRKLLTRSLVFTNLNLFKIYGFPERFFTFNAVIDERDFYISNNSWNKSFSLLMIKIGFILQSLISQKKILIL